MFPSMKSKKNSALASFMLLLTIVSTVLNSTIFYKVTEEYEQQYSYQNAVEKIDMPQSNSRKNSVLSRRTSLTGQYVNKSESPPKIIEDNNGKDAAMNNEKIVMVSKKDKRQLLSTGFVVDSAAADGGDDDDVAKKDKVAKKVTSASSTSFVDENSTVMTTTTVTVTEKKATHPVNPPRFGGHNGGIVVFYHVAKTGGNTVRGIFDRLKSPDDTDPFQYIRIRTKPSRNIVATMPQNNNNNNQTLSSSQCVPPAKGYKNANKVFRLIHKFVKQPIRGRKTKTALVEIHGDSSGMGKQLADQIQELRQACLEHNRPFFAFTLVRDPLPFALSYFTMFHTNCNMGWCEHQQFDEANEHNLLQSLRPNRQCFLLTHTSAIEGIHPSFYDKCKVTKEDCDDTYLKMKNSLDWIGTTEHLTTETIPLLEYMLKLDNGRDKGFTGITKEKMDKNVQQKLPYERKILLAAAAGNNNSDESDATTNEIVAKIRSLSTYDQAIYDQVKKDYVLKDRFVW